MQSEDEGEQVQKVQKYKQPDRNAGPNDDADETLGERLRGVIEMLPEPVIRFTSNVADKTKNVLAGAFAFTCNVSWAIFISALILFVPIIYETERAHMQEGHGRIKQTRHGISISTSAAEQID